MNKTNRNTMYSEISNVFFRGICYDEKSSFKRGPANAPNGIREALYSGSMNWFTEDLKNLDFLPESDLGDFIPNDYEAIYSLTREQLKVGQGLLTLGGDHSITYPILKAFREIYPKLDVLHIDAHADLYDRYDGDPFSHACPFARIMEEKLADRLVQVGIRTLNAHQQEQANRFGVQIIEMKEFDAQHIFHFENPLYISLDMDALDPAFAPGVSHREPGGMSTRDVISILQNIKGKVVGADLVEYNPNQDLGQTTAFVGAKLMKELLGKMV